jgi:predicted nucleotidyltransferase component of viral defense system
MITEGYLLRHANGRMLDVALLDVAQDYALEYLHEAGVIDLGVALKGGTALRKVRAGHDGRFSTDLDFAVPDDTTLQLLLDTIDGASLHDVRFSLERRKGPHADLRIVTPRGAVAVPARIDVTVRPLWLPVEVLPYVALPVHDGYEFTPRPLSVPCLDEALAEKLAAWRRRRQMRDLYDLNWFGHRALNEPLIRRAMVLKIWYDVVDEDRGTKPFDPQEIISVGNVGDVADDEIHLLTKPVEPVKWLSYVSQRYRFVTQLDETEQRIIACTARDRREVEALVASLHSDFPAEDT